MDQQLLTIDAVGQRLGLSRSAVYTLVMKGEISSLLIGRSRRVAISAISAFIERKEQETSGNPNPPTPTKA